MSTKHNRFQREHGTKRYRPRIVIVTEGSVTERNYLRQLQALYPDVIIDMVRQNNQSAPYYLIKKMTQYLEREPLLDRDRAWLVVDTDAWSNTQIHAIQQWRGTDRRHAVGISNPNFELWLLLHFESGVGVQSAQEVSILLKRHVPHNPKHIEGFRLTRELLQCAIVHARQRLRPHPADRLPPPAGSTTMHVLVEGLETIGT